MTDSQQADNAEEKQQEPVPSSEEQSTEINQSQEVAQETGEASEAPAGDSEELELPKGTKERTTEQFEKLREQLRQTRDELFQVKSKVEPKADEELKPLYDPKTGLVDIQALEQLRKDASEARRELAQMKSQGKDREVQELYESHPELDPNAKSFNQKVFDEAEKIWLHSQAHPDRYDGRPLTQKQAADRAKQIMQGTKVDSNAEEKEASNDAKQQASVQASGKPTQAVARQTSQEDLEQLKFGTRMNDKNAMIARLRMIRESGKA